MPGLHYLDNPYGNLDAASRMGSSLGNVARSRQLLPYIQMQQALRQQALQSQMQLNAAHQQLYRAQSAREEASRLYDMARREKIQKELEASVGLRKAVEGGFEDLPSMGVGGAPMMVDNPDRAVAGATAQMLPANSDLVKQVMQLRMMGDPTMARMIATGSHMPTERDTGFTLSPGAIRFDASGNPIAEAPMKPPTERDPAVGLAALNTIATDDLADPTLRNAVKSELARRAAMLQGRGAAPGTGATNSAMPPAPTVSAPQPGGTTSGGFRVVSIVPAGQAATTPTATAPAPPPQVPVAPPPPSPIAAIPGLQNRMAPTLPPAGNIAARTAGADRAAAEAAARAQEAAQTRAANMAGERRAAATSELAANVAANARAAQATASDRANRQAFLSDLKDQYTRLKTANTGRGTNMGADEYNRRYAELAKAFQGLSPEEQASILGTKAP